jgi:cytochrome d ubiquinol oxidase subunit II
LALAVFLLAGSAAPEIQVGLTYSVWGRIALVSAAALGVGAVFCLWRRRFRWARLCAVSQVVLILWGWAGAQYPYLVEPTWTIWNAAAPPETLRLLAIALIVGAFFLFPSLYYLYRVFKKRAVFGEPH